MKKNGFELTAVFTSLVLTVVAIILFAISYTTGYYVFGQMQSKIIAIVVGGALLSEIACVILGMKFPDADWPKFLIFFVVAHLAAGAMMLLGDRVEGIGNCIITDYDSGHGGEEAIWLSLAAVILMLAAMIYSIIGSFSGGISNLETYSRKRRTRRIAGFGISAGAVLLAVGIPTYAFMGGKDSNMSAAAGEEKGNTYTISFNQANNNAEDMPDYQFLCNDLGGLVKADSRMYVDVTLTLDGNGNYTLFTDAYVMDSGNRAVIGDNTGVGMVLTTTAEGTYEENADGTITTSVPVHAVFEMETDTYSDQIKSVFNLNVNGNGEDGIYDSDDEPAVLSFVPETLWTLSENNIITYYNPDGILESGEEPEEPDETEEIEEPQETDEVEDTASVETLTVASDDGSTTMTFNSDGTYLFAFEAYGVEDPGTYIYEGGILTTMNANGDTAKAEGDPLKLHYVSSMSDQLTGDFSILTENLAALSDHEDKSDEYFTVTSEDGSTIIEFNTDGTYRFAFDAFGVEDFGKYNYDGMTLTIINANGNEITATGDPYQFHYISSMSDQLTGDFSVPAASFQ